VNGTCEVRFTRYYSATPDEVWAALTEPDSVARWLGPVRKIELTPGGRFELELERWTMQGRVRALEPARLLELDWLDVDASPSIVRVELSEDGDGTALVLDHRQIDALIGMLYMGRWEVSLARLEAVVER
jgi:uncharacterized protein YndB with AHSA1/START domain